jgi:hypothetical protein
MPRTFSLTASEQHALERLRATSPQPYVRERAAALLQIAQGAAPSHVARHGLLQPRDPDTVYAWLDRYLVEGIAGLTIRPGRGRTPAFSPLVR